MTRTMMVAAAFLGLCRVPAHAQPRAFALPPGPFAVGFRSIDLYDYARAYRETTTASGRPETRERARPVQTSIWYPAKKTGGRPFRYLEYIKLMAHQDGPPTAAEVTRYLDRLTANPQAKAQVDAIKGQLTGAVRNAPPAPGKFPLVVYSAGGGAPSFDNAVLFECLASQGYVVIASPSTWNWERLIPIGTEIPSAEAAARDMEFHLGYSRGLPFVDQGKVALMGFSWGGIAGPIVASRNSRISAVVNLDGSVKYYYDLYRQATHHDPAGIRAAFLQLSSSVERTQLAATLRGRTMDSAEVAFLSAPFRFYQGIRYADAYAGTMRRFVHNDFQSLGTLFEDPDRKGGEPTLAENRAGYAVVAQYVLHFLDGYLKGNAEARDWLRRTPAENGIPAGVLDFGSRPASPLPAPTIEGFARYAATNGLDRLKLLVDSARKADSTYDLTETMAGTWAEVLKQDGKAGLGRAVLDWNIERRPASASALGTLCFWLDATTERTARKDCLTKLVALDPKNEDAKRALVELNPR